MRSSSDWVRDKNGQWQRTQVQQTRGLNLTHNHHLKAIFKGAATTVIAQHPDEPLNAAYRATPSRCTSVVLLKRKRTLGGQAEVQ
jgi:hypothetical protein